MDTLVEVFLSYSDRALGNKYSLSYTELRDLIQKELNHRMKVSPKVWDRYEHHCRLVLKLVQIQTTNHQGLMRPTFVHRGRLLHVASFRLTSCVSDSNTNTL